MSIRNEVIQVKVTAEEKAEIKALAAKDHESVGEYMRNQALDLRIKLREDKELLAAREGVKSDPSNLTATLDEKGSVVKDEALRPHRESWIQSTARTLMMEKGLSKHTARAEAEKQWEAANG